jgi:hypothetical protein
MFNIVGADGNKYGPVTADQLRQWIHQGRVNGRTQAQAEGAAEWKPLADFPEFATLFNPAGTGAPPLQTSLTPPPAAAPPPEPDQLVAEVLARQPRIEIGACFGRAWTLVTERFWLSVGVGLVGLVLFNVPLLTGPAYAGLFWFFLRRIRREEAKFEDVFAPFSVAFVQTLVAGIVWSLLITAGILLCFIPGIVFSALWLFTWPLLMDKRLDFWPAMEVSRRVLWPNIWGALGLFLAGMLAIIVGQLCLCVGVFVAFPLVIAAQAYAYEDFFGRQKLSMPPAPNNQMTTSHV